MLKIVVYDSGYGGEVFADELEKALPIVEVIRVIDWRNADKILSSQKQAREVATAALRPYIGKVDLIIFANYFLSATSLKYFQRTYKEQKFIGLSLSPAKISGRAIVLTTKALSKTINYHNYLFRLKAKSRTMVLDDWPYKIDQGELNYDEIRAKLIIFMEKENWYVQNLVLACSHFNDIKRELKKVLGRGAKIYDSNEETIRQACKLLRIRGSLRKK